MSSVISEIGGWITALLGWLFGTTSGSTTTPGILDAVLGEPVLLACIIGLPLSIALVRFVVGLIRRAVSSAT